MKKSLIKALTKRVYGIFTSLGNEPFGEKYRFRVTKKMRVHYRVEEDGKLVFEEFGPHSLGGID